VYTGLYGIIFINACFYNRCHGNNTFEEFQVPCILSISRLVAIICC
jgi:hypothetical protein